MTWANDIIFNSFTVHMLKKHLVAGDKSALVLDTIVEGHGRGFDQIRPNMDNKSVQEKLAVEKREG